MTSGLVLQLNTAQLGFWSMFLHLYIFIELNSKHTHNFTEKLFRGTARGSL